MSPNLKFSFQIQVIDLVSSDSSSSEDENEEEIKEETDEVGFT